MQEIDLSEMQKFIDGLQNFTKRDVRKLFREEHESARDEMLRLVRGELPESRKVAGWQEKYVGSGGGYAAIRPEIGSHEGYAKGHITNAIENGHLVRARASQKSHGYHRYTGRFRVEGLGFYKNARSAMKSVAQEHAKSLEDKIKNGLESL